MYLFTFLLIYLLLFYLSTYLLITCLPIYSFPCWFTSLPEIIQVRMCLCIGDPVPMTRPSYWLVYLLTCWFTDLLTWFYSWQHVPENLCPRQGFRMLAENRNPMPRLTCGDSTSESAGTRRTNWGERDLGGRPSRLFFLLVCSKAGARSWDGRSCCFGDCCWVGSSVGIVSCGSIVCECVLCMWVCVVCGVCDLMRDDLEVCAWWSWGVCMHACMHACMCIVVCLHMVCACMHGWWWWWWWWKC